METDLGYDEGQFICLMLADSLRHQQASAQDIHRGACGRDARPSVLCLHLLFHLPSLLTNLGVHPQGHCPWFSLGTPES